jgi:hypothetical protein
MDSPEGIRVNGEMKNNGNPEQGKGKIKGIRSSGKGK